MKSLRLLVLLSAMVVTAPHRRRALRMGTTRTSVHARAIGQNLGHGQTEATIVHAGILNGTTVGQLQITGGTPPVVTVVGTGVLTTDHGTLTVSVVGTFNGATGCFGRPVRSFTGPACSPARPECSRLRDSRI